MLFSLGTDDPEMRRIKEILYGYNSHQLEQKQQQK
jgi:hypothetical protein